jgi:hypothetical protein
MIVGRIRSHSRDARRGNKLQPAAANSDRFENASNYFIVTFNAVVRPVFTVAAVLTLAKPGAATVTV